MSRCIYLFICNFNTIKVCKSGSEARDKLVYIYAKSRAAFRWSIYRESTDQMPTPQWSPYTDRVLSNAPPRRA